MVAVVPVYSLLQTIYIGTGIAQLALTLAAIDGQHPMRLERRQGFSIIPIHLVGARFLLLFVPDADYFQGTALKEVLFDSGPVFRILRYPFGDDIHRAADGFLRR